MENAIQSRLRAEPREDVVVSCEGCELLKVHHFLAMGSVPTNILWIQILQGAEKFTHEIDHDPGVH